jgi:hypothetical protein
MPGFLPTTSWRLYPVRVVKASLTVRIRCSVSVTMTPSEARSKTIAASRRLLFRTLAGGDVGGLEAGAGNRSVVVEERKANDQEVAGAAVRGRISSRSMPLRRRIASSSLSRKRSQTPRGKSCRSVLPIACRR